MKTQKPLKSHELRELEEKLFEKLGWRLKGYLIEQAFTRSSYARRYGGGSNEMLEFIGDTLLGYHIVHQLFNHYGTIHSDDSECFYTFRAHENDFTALKSKIVSNQTLASIIDEWDVCKYLIVGKSDIDNEVDKQEKIKADLFEAIIGACAVESHWNTEIMDQIISKVLPVEQYILDYEKTQFRLPEFNAGNSINTLKEMAEHEECSFPLYEINGPDVLGYDKSGNPIWSCCCRVQDKGVTKIVFANSMKAAKKYASYLVLCDIFELPNEYGPCKRLPVWYLNKGLLTVDQPEQFSH